MDIYTQLVNYALKIIYIVYVIYVVISVPFFIKYANKVFSDVKFIFLLRKLGLVDTIYYEDVKSNLLSSLDFIVLFLPGFIIFAYFFIITMFGGFIG